MSPHDFWKTPGYSIEPHPMSNRIYSDMKPHTTNTDDREKLEVVYTVSSPNFFQPVKPIAPHSTPRRLLRFPSGLEVEDMTERNPRPLWPLVLCALLIWAAVVGCAYYLAA